MTGPKYPNQQLRSVSLETYFAGRFSVLAGLRDVQDEFGKDFPNLFVPNASEGQALDLAPYVLRTEDGIRALAVAINQATFMTTAYPGFEAFSKEGIAKLSRILELIGISKLNRVVYKYENAIGLSRDTDRSLPIGRIFDFALPDESHLDRVRHINLQWNRAWSRGQFLGHLFIEKQAQEVLVAVFAAIVDPAGSVADLQEFVRLAHKEAVGVFERTITDGFRTVIKGDDDEEGEG